MALKISRPPVFAGVMALKPVAALARPCQRFTGDVALIERLPADDESH